MLSGSAVVKRRLTPLSAEVLSLALHGQDKAHVLCAQQGPGTMRQCKLSEAFKTGYVLLKRGGELGPFLANFLICKNLTVPDKVGCCAEPTTDAHAVLICKSVCSAETRGQRRSAEAAWLLVLEAEAEPSQGEFAILLQAQF